MARYYNITVRVEDSSPWYPQEGLALFDDESTEAAVIFQVNRF